MNIEIRDEREDGRYTAYLDGARLGHATWVKVHDTVVLPHTEVDPAWEGRGIGSLLARRAFEDARADGLTVLPFCPFMKRWAELHPDYQDVVRAPRPGEMPSIDSALHAARTLESLARSKSATPAHPAPAPAPPSSSAAPTATSQPNP
jgi:predicted GNAT family acetyltransferase